MAAFIILGECPDNKTIILIYHQKSLAIADNYDKVDTMKNFGTRIDSLAARIWWRA